MALTQSRRRLERHADDADVPIHCNSARQLGDNPLVQADAFAFRFPREAPVEGLGQAHAQVAGVAPLGWRNRLAVLLRG